MNDPETPPLSVAPMMNRTDRHFRFFIRQITDRTLLYTQMLTPSDILDGEGDPLAYSPVEHPLALQVGGSDPERMAACARRAEQRGFDEININVCCPSNRVQQGEFGVYLMGEPERVGRCVATMREAADLPVTVKHRIGFDDRDEYDQMVDFVQTVVDAGCHRVTVHARKAWLDGLSPTENRNVPPIRHGDVHRLAEEFPALDVELNGEVETLDEVETHLEHVDACMIGRASYQTPWLFAEADRRIFGKAPSTTTRREVAAAMADYAEWWLSEGGKMAHIVDHLMNLYAGQPGAGTWRSYLGEHGQHPDADPAVILDACERTEAVRSRHSAA